LSRPITLLLSASLTIALLLIHNADASAKILPTGRPDIRLDIVTEQRFSTSENLQSVYADVGKVHEVFDEVMVLSLYRFVEEHWAELAGKSVDSVWISYSVPGTVRVSVGAVHGTTLIEEESFPELKTISSIAVRMPVSWWYHSEGQYTHWLYSGAQIPNASARVAYLTNQAQDLLARHQSELITSVTVDEQGADIGKQFLGVSGIMLEDMSRISVSYREEGYAYTERTITEYGNGMLLVVPIQTSPGSLYTPPQLELNEPISLAKSAGKPLSIVADLSTYDKVLNATLSHPDGQEAPLDLVSIESEQSESESEPYNHYRYAYYLESDEASGIYKLFIHSSPTSSPPTTDLSVSIREGYFPPDYDNWTVETISVDDAGYAVRYRIDDDVQVRTISIDIPKRSVVIEIANAKPDSELTIELPRDLIDSVFEDDADKSFLVTQSDTNSLQHEEILVNDQVRVLTIDLDQNSDLVQIRGTQIVPEFNPAFVLSISAAAIASSIMVVQRVKHLGKIK
jgi:hypothetical protein